MPLELSCAGTEALVPVALADLHVSGPFFLIALAAGHGSDHRAPAYLFHAYDARDGILSCRLVVSERIQVVESRLVKICLVLLFESRAPESRHRQAERALCHLVAELRRRYLEEPVAVREAPAVQDRACLEVREIDVLRILEDRLIGKNETGRAVVAYRSLRFRFVVFFIITDEISQGLSDRSVIVAPLFACRFFCYFLDFLIILIVLVVFSCIREN